MHEGASLAGCPPKLIRGPGDSPGTGESETPRPQRREAKQVSLTALGEEEVLATLRGSTPVENLTPFRRWEPLRAKKGKL